jgi:hypothetical protein
MEVAFQRANTSFQERTQEIHTEFVRIQQEQAHQDQFLKKRLDILERTVVRLADPTAETFSLQPKTRTRLVEPTPISIPPPLPRIDLMIPPQPRVVVPIAIETECAFELEEVEKTREAFTSFPPVGTVHQVHVSAINTVPNAYPTFLHPCQQEVLKSLIKPKFTGYAYDWPQFVRDWDKYVIRIACGQILSDPEKLALFESAIDRESNLWLQSLKDSDEGTSYQLFFAKMEDRFGLHRDRGTRQKWHDVRLTDSSKITPREWESFRIRFQMAQKEVLDATEEESYRIFTARLSHFMLQWVAQKE